MAEAEEKIGQKRPREAAKYSVSTAEGAAATGAKWTRFPIRVRAHRNPLSDNDDVHPAHPGALDWDKMYPEREGRKVEVLDIGCAYAGLLSKLAPLFPSTLMLGMEIRDKVAAFSQERIERLRRKEFAEGDHVTHAHHYNNIWVTQGNAMKYLPNFLEKGQLKRMFFCYPDPHWKARNVRRRIIQEALTHEYAFVLAEGGLLYTVTDVKELGDWMQKHLDDSPLFERLSAEEMAADPYLEYVINSSEDAVRTTKQCLTKHYSIHRKKPLPPL